MTTPLNPDRDHRISPEEAAEMTRRHRMQVTVSGARRPEDGSLGGLFSAKQVIDLLTKSGAEYLRYYHARDKEGKRTLVLVAADAKGNDLISSTTEVLDQHWSCPPFCPEATSSLRG
ncbi:MAG TPA: hypothetical protein PKC83_06985 [Gemmatimonadaceae bacterium]|jgi:hypothetical protein|nr:hypothetical protein [Gemmatimonadaceae bacterium]